MIIRKKDSSYNEAKQRGVPLKHSFESEVIYL